MASAALTLSLDTEALARIERRLEWASRPIAPVVRHFGVELGRAIAQNFASGGRPPWKRNRPNTVAGKGHGRVLEGARGPRLAASVHVRPTDDGLAVTGPDVALFHQQGRLGPWIIRAKQGKFLRFVVAEKTGAFHQRRKRALARRRAGERVTIPSRRAAQVVFAKEVRHPGFPARPFIVITRAFLRTAWERPLDDFLFEGRVPA